MVKIKQNIREAVPSLRGIRNRRVGNYEKV